MQKFKFFTLAILAMLSVNFVWGDSFVINTTNFTAPNSGSGYAAYNGTRTISDIDITSNKVMVQSAKLQFQKASDCYLFNADAMPGNITKITLSTPSNFTIYVGTSSHPTSGSVTSGSTISGSNKYFTVKGSSSATATTATITVEYTSAATPTLTTSANSLAFGSIENNTTKSLNTLTVSGSNLTNNITFSITGTNASYFTVTNPASISKGSGTVAATAITVQYAPKATGNHNATLQIISSGATTKEVSLTGTATAPAVKYTVTFNAGTGTCGTASLTEASAGAGVNLPVASPSSACGTDGWTFAGWATASQTETTTAPTSYAANSNYKPSSNCTLHAVYSKTESGSGPTKWTVATSIAAGDVVVISTNQSYTDHAMKTAGTISSNLMGCCASTYNSDKSEITSLESGTLQFTIGGNSTSGYTLKNGDNYLGMSGDKKVALSSTSSTWSISFSGTTATVSQLYTPTGKSEGNYSLQYNYNNSSDRFTGYTSAQVAVSLYKKSSGTTTYNSNPSCATCTNLINITKGTPSNGSFTLTGAGTDICADEPVTVNLSNITADPHYHATAVTTSATTGGGTPSAITSDGSASVTGITASTTINVTFEADTKVTVTLLNNNVPVEDSEFGFNAQGKKEYYTGETLGTLPTLTSAVACDATSTTFMGWTSDAGFQKRAAPPSSFVTPSTTVTGDMTLRAVWARAQ